MDRPAITVNLNQSLQKVLEAGDMGHWHTVTHRDWLGVWGCRGDGRKAGAKGGGW